MAQKTIRTVFTVRGMVCSGCELKIEEGLRGLAGIESVKADFAASSVEVVYDPGLVTREAIAEAIGKLGYSAEGNAADGGLPAGEHREKKAETSPLRLAGILVILLAAYLIVKNTAGFDFLPDLTQNMGYGLLFVVGLMTSVHCIAMCGGINLSQCVANRPALKAGGKWAGLRPSILYNAGRVLSYTLVGGVVGALGSVVSFSGTAKGLVAVLSGLFMIVMGLNMLNLFPWLRRLGPRMPRWVGRRVRSGGGGRGPFYVGLLNGLMPCGPLQAMQIYALGTGSALLGAASMLAFSLGTVPLMFGFGAVSTLLSSRFTHRMMKVSAALVLVLGLVMLNRGFALSGIALPVGLSASAADVSNVAQVEGDVQTVRTTLQSGAYAPIVVQKGIPVKWIIEADEATINGCNKTISIPKYNLSQTLAAGENEIDFTPEEEGTIPYSCWMGMIRSSITVVSDVGDPSAAAAQQPEDPGSALSGGGCCGTAPAGFEDGKVPVDQIGLAKVSGGEQEVTVTVDGRGYTPAVIVLQKGIPARIRFDPAQIDGCNDIVIFPEYNGGIDLNTDTETPLLTPEEDFTFQCGMGMLHGYVKVVEDLNQVDLDAIREEVSNYVPAGGGGCC